MEASRKKRLQLALSALGGALVALALAYLAAAELLPVLIERELKQVSAELMNSKNFSCESLRIGLFSSSATGVRIGKGALPPLYFDYCEIRYTPFGVLRGSLDKVVLKGAKARLAVQNGKTYLNGAELDLSALPSGPKGETPQAELLDGIAALPFKIKLIEISKSELSAVWETGRISVPFEIAVKPDSTEWRTANVFIEAAPNGQRVKLRARLARDERSVELQAWTPEKIQLEALPLSRAVKIPEGAGAAGDLSFDAKARVSPVERKLEKAFLKACAERLVVKAGPLELRGSPLELVLRWQDGKGSLEATGLRLGGQLPLTMKSLSCETSLKDGALFARALLKLEGDEGANGLNGDAELEGLLECPASEFVPASAAGSLRMAGARKELRLKLDGVSLLANAPEAKFRVDLKASSLTASATLPSFTAEGHGFELEASGAKASVQANGLEKAKFSASLDSCRLKDEDFSARLSAPALNAELENGALQGEASCPDAKADAPALGVKIAGASLRLPFKLPAKGAPPAGELKIESASLNGGAAGSLSGALSFDGKELKAKGKFSSVWEKGLSLNFESSGRLNGTTPVVKVKLSLPKTKIEEPLALGLLVPKAKGLFFRGELQLDGAFALEGAKRSGSLALNVKDGELKDAKGLFSVEGVNLKVKLPALPEIRSEPSQMLTFAQARLGKISLGDGLTTLRVDSRERLFFEGFRANFCGGVVRTHCFSINPASPGDLRLVLHCDRVSIAKMLSQAGFGQAEGEGSLNGVIPIEMKDGEISFHDAFLYSTPGEHGVIRIDDNGLLSMGFGGAEGSTPMAIARHSLKNYKYAWAKAGLDTRGETATLKLHLDGKPDCPLPFRIDDDGGYVPDVDGKLLFQGVRLDLNFTAPLSQILGIGGDLKKITNDKESEK